MRPIRAPKERCALALLFTVLSLAACKNSGGDSARQRCIEARGIVAELSANAPASKRVSEKRIAAERAKHARSLDRSLGERFVEQCLAAEPAYRECLLEASDRGDLRRCRTLLSRK